MKTLTLILITTILITSMADGFGQPSSKNEKRNGFRHKVNNESLKSHKALGNDYSFSKTTGTYLDLTAAISLNNNQLWDDPQYAIPIGFNFNLFDITIDSLYVGIGVGGLVSSKIDQNYEAQYRINPFETDLIDRGDFIGTSQSPISYQIDGSQGSRVLKIEWKNAGFYLENYESGTLNDYINFQLWLYEGSNDIEMHFGSNMITDPTINYNGETGASIGLVDWDIITWDLTNGYLLSGVASNPTPVNSLDYINGTPPDGTIYKFSKNAANIEDNNLIVNTIKVYPNPTSGVFTVERITQKINPYQITDNAGKVIHHGILTDIATTIDLSNNERGLYFLKVDGQTTKLIKQ